MLEWFEIFNICIDDEGAIKRFIIGLIAECPFGGNPTDCQVSQVRELSMKQRINWIDELPLEERKEFYLNHKFCYDAKDSA